MKSLIHILFAKKIRKNEKLELEIKAKMDFIKFSSDEIIEDCQRRILGSQNILEPCQN